MLVLLVVQTSGMNFSRIFHIQHLLENAQNGPSVKTRKRATDKDGG